MTERDPRFLARRPEAADVGPLLHLRFEGKSREIAFDILDIGTASTDEAVRAAVAAFLDINPARLTGTVLERHENGNMTLRPEALFG